MCKTNVLRQYLKLITAYSICKNVGYGILKNMKYFENLSTYIFSLNFSSNILLHILEFRRYCLKFKSTKVTFKETCLLLFFSLKFKKVPRIYKIKKINKFL